MGRFARVSSGLISLDSAIYTSVNGAAWTRSVGAQQHREGKHARRHPASRPRTLFPNYTFSGSSEEREIISSIFFFLPTAAKLIQSGALPFAKRLSLSLPGGGIHFDHRRPGSKGVEMRKERSIR